jgi:inorganic triphosphatase YgiF
MSAPREIELKLAVARWDVVRLRRVLAQFGRPRTERLETVYYDTRDFALARRKIALRLRRTAAGWLQTLKLGGVEAALSDRTEYEVPVAGARLELQQFAETPLGALLRANRLQVAPRFRTRFARSVWMTPENAIEIALDDGEIIAGRRRTPILELELELKAGRPQRLWALASSLTDRGRDAIALVPFAESKAVRGVRLALGEALVPVKANAAAFTGRLKADLPAGAALRLLIGAGAEILLANLRGMKAADDPEFVHQARVAVRRMRSAVRLFAHDVHFPRRLAADLRWIGRELGRVRDWDVLALQTLPALRMSSAALDRAVARQRRAVSRQVRASARSGRCAQLAVNLLRWSAAEDATGPALVARAERDLRKARRRLHRAARHFDRQTPAQQHRVRILAKRLRYAVDVFAPALEGLASDALRATVARAQDALGDLCDLDSARHMLDDIGLAPQTIAPIRAGLNRLREFRAGAAGAALAELRRDGDR